MNDSDKDPLVEKKVTPEMRRLAWREFFKREKKFLVLGSLLPTAILILLSHLIKFIYSHYSYLVSDVEGITTATIVFIIGGYLFAILTSWSWFLFAIIAKFAKAQGFKKPSILQWLGDAGMAYNCIRSSFVSRFWRRVYIIAIGLNFIGVPYTILASIATEAALEALEANWQKHYG